MTRTPKAACNCWVFARVRGVQQASERVEILAVESWGAAATGARWRALVGCLAILRYITGATGLVCLIWPQIFTSFLHKAEPTSAQTLS
jgi:hypothetical protein